MSEEEMKLAGRRRGRRYSLEEKLRLLDEADQPGESIGTVSRRHGVSSSVMFRWRQMRESGALTGLKADEEVVPASEMKAARAKIRELQRLLGKKTEEVEILQEGLEYARSKKWIPQQPLSAAAVVKERGRQVRAVARAFGVARSQLQVRASAGQALVCPADTGSGSSPAVAVKGAGPAQGPSRREPLTATRTAADEELASDLKALVGQRPSYGYRRATAMLNRRRRHKGQPRLNHKRVYRVMREHDLLLERCTGKRPGRVHDGTLMTEAPNTRWCSDALEIRCWPGERVYMAFALDCCDRQILAHHASVEPIAGENIRDMMLALVEKRFGPDARRTPGDIEWLSDNGSPYAAIDTIDFGGKLGLIPCFTPPYSPQSNGMVEAIVKGFKRDYVYVNEPQDAATVITAIDEWIRDYNEVRPHAALNFLSPMEYTQQAA